MMLCVRIPLKSLVRYVTQAMMSLLEISLIENICNINKRKSEKIQPGFNIL